MCAIAGLIANSSARQTVDIVQTVSRMLESQRARGPDEIGLYHKRSVCMGHRLLRILPCAESAQPMWSINGNAAITFNGEIYNFRELRRELIAKGVRFQSDTDTEVVLELYRQYGTQFLHRMRGMFAFAIHDLTARKVILGRDLFGRKPLYVSRSGSRTVFASTIRAITSASENACVVDEDAMRSYCWMLMPETGKTLLRGVEILRAGSFLVLDEDGRTMEEGLYSNSPAEATPTRSGAEASGHFLELLAQAVTEQTDGVSVFATHLSGGLDSSAITCGAVGLPGASITTYSCSYLTLPSETAHDEAGYEEAHYANMVAQHLGVPNVVVGVSPDDYFFDLVELVDVLDEPRGNPSLPHFELARAVAVEHRVVLSGEGADELFGGYPWKIRNAFAEASSSKAFWESLLPAPPMLLGSALRGSLADPSQCYEYVSERVCGIDAKVRLKKMMAFDQEHFLHYLLLQADKLAGRFGMEARYPFLDERLVAFAGALPTDELFVEGGPAKPVIRRALKGRLPAEVLARPKIGFVAPEGSWYRNALRSLVHNLLLGPNSFVTTIYHRSKLEQLVDAHMSGKFNFRKLIWSLMSLEVWHKMLIEGVPKTALQDRIQALRFDGRKRRFAT